MKIIFTKHGVTVINPEEETKSGGKDFGGCICSLEEGKLT